MDTCRPVLSTNMSISVHTSASYRTDGPRKKQWVKNNSISRLDEELLSISESSFLVNADVVGLYPSIPHNEGNSALKQKLEEQPPTKIPTNDLVKLAEFVLKNNLFEFNDR